MTIKFRQNYSLCDFFNQNGIESLNYFLESAKPSKNVMWWAEYENRESIDNNKKVRDFSKTFKQNTI